MTLKIENAVVVSIAVEFVMDELRGCGTDDGLVFNSKIEIGVDAAVLFREFVKGAVEVSGDVVDVIFDVKTLFCDTLRNKPIECGWLTDGTVVNKDEVCSVA